MTTNQQPACALGGLPPDVKRTSLVHHQKSFTPLNVEAKKNLTGTKPDNR